MSPKVHQTEPKELIKSIKFCPMFIKAIPTPEPINLSQFNDFAEKFVALQEYASITSIYFEVTNPEDIKSNEGFYLKIIQLIVPGGTTSYINNKLKECHKIISDELSKFLQKEEDFHVIDETIKRCIEKATQASKENNVYNNYSFNQQIKCKVYKDGNWENVLFHFLEWPNTNMLEDLKEHFSIRKGFFDELNMTLNKGLLLHHSTPVKKAYSWDSKNAELEISELIYVLHFLAQRIKIDTTQGASFSKFRKDFFELFGVKASNYDKKALQIKTRKHNESFMNELAEQLRKKHESKKSKSV